MSAEGAKPQGRSPAGQSLLESFAPTLGRDVGPSDPPSPRWSEEVDAFLRAKTLEVPVGAGWTRRMRWELLRFPQLLVATGVAPVPRSAMEVGRPHLQALRDHLRWERATFAIHYAALRQFLRWSGNSLAESGSVWRLPSGQPTHRRWLSREQLGRLLAAARGRERALVALEGLNGLRRVEVLRLRRQDVLLDEECLRVLGKGRDGGKWRKIPIHPAVLDALRSLGPDCPADARLFPLSASGADLALARTAQRAGLLAEGVRVSHHDLRRTFGRLAHESGMDLVQLKNLLGHASLDMTVHYIGLDSEEMRRGLRRLQLTTARPGATRAGARSRSRGALRPRPGRPRRIGR